MEVVRCMVKQAAGYSLQLPVATYNTKTQAYSSLTPSVKQTLDHVFEGSQLMRCRPHR